jgi:hypothetical protein
MSLSDLAAIGSLVSGVAVLVSLIYLALQTRQNVLNQRAVNHHGRAQELSSFLRFITQEDLAGIVDRAAAGDNSLSDVEIVRYLWATQSILVTTEETFLQHEAGLLDAQFWASIERGTRLQCTIPGFRACWPLLRDRFAPEFTSYIDQLIRSTPPTAELLGVPNAWRSLVALEMKNASIAAAGKT